MNILFKPALYFTKGRANNSKPDIIVCHIADGTYAGTIAWFQSTQNTGKVSSHYVVSKAGEVTQMVKLTDTAHCNGTSTDPASSVYFGHATNTLVKGRTTNANAYTVSIEFEGFYKDAMGKLTPEQLKAGIELIAHIKSEIKSTYGTDIAVNRNHIIGHCEINPKTKPNCPGQAFQWDELIAGVKGLTESKKLWRVQVGAYSLKSNAEKMAAKLKADGYPAIIKED